MDREPGKCIFACTVSRTYKLVIMNTKLSPDHICFGLNRQLDESSISTYLQLIGRKEMADTLATRLTETEIHEIVDLFTVLMKRHFTEKEYHELFLRDATPEKICNII